MLKQLKSKFEVDTKVVNERTIRKTYFLDEEPLKKIQSHKPIVKEEPLPKELFRVLGKVLTFVEQVDEKNKHSL